MQFDVIAKTNLVVRDYKQTVHPAVIGRNSIIMLPYRYSGWMHYPQRDPVWMLPIPRVHTVPYWR